jgi:soluble cytochrome b562
LGEPLRALCALASGYPLHHAPQPLRVCLRVVPLLSLSQNTLFPPHYQATIHFFYHFKYKIFNMKKLLFSLFVVLGLSQVASAQAPIQLREETKAFSLGSYNALVMPLKGTKKKEVEKEWQSFIKDYKGKTKTTKAGEIFTDDAIIKKISPNTVDIYAKVVETTEGTELSVWFNVGLVYLSSKDFPEQYPGADAILKEFAGTVSATMIAEELKAQEKALKELEEELKKLEKEKTGRDKDISDYRETIKKQEDNIRKAEDDIKTNLKNQEDKTKQINDQKKLVEEVAERLKKAGGKK